jgi:hypothetical protein
MKYVEVLHASEVLPRTSDAYLTRVEVRHSREVLPRQKYVQVKNQPSQSPDFNVLDLGFFRAIQSLQRKKHCKTILDLMRCVEEAWQESSIESIDNLFVTQQLVWQEAMRTGGDNKFKIPHIGKKKLRAECRMPVQVVVPPELYRSVFYIRI